MYILLHTTLALKLIRRASHYYTGTDIKYPTKI